MCVLTWMYIFPNIYVESVQYERYYMVEVAGSRMINPKFFYACLGVIFIDHTNLPDHRL